MVLKVYISGMSGNKEVKKRQQRVLMILDSKNIKYEIIDITEPGRESDKEFMQNKSTSNGATVSDPEPRHALPPQLFNDEGYCGDYDAFDLANEIDTLEQFLKLEPSDNNTNTTNNAPIIDTGNTQNEFKQENGNANDEDNKENDGSEPNKDDETAEKSECKRLMRPLLLYNSDVKATVIIKVSIEIFKNHNNEAKISSEENTIIDSSIETSHKIQTERDMNKINERIFGNQEKHEQSLDLSLNGEALKIEKIATTTTIIAPTISTTTDNVIEEISVSDNILDRNISDSNKLEEVITSENKTMDLAPKENIAKIIMEEKEFKKSKLDKQISDNTINLDNVEEMRNTENNSNEINEIDVGKQNNCGKSYKQSSELKENEKSENNDDIDDDTDMILVKDTSSKDNNCENIEKSQETTTTIFENEEKSKINNEILGINDKKEQKF